jgi:hypothetical protein
MWRDAANVSVLLSSVSQESGYPVLSQFGVGVFGLLPAFFLVAAIAVPTTLAASFLVKRDISVSS